MTNGKSSSNQKSEDTQTFELEDRNYYIHLGAIYTREEYDFLFEKGCIGKFEYEKSIKHPAVTNHWWMDLVKKGYQMYSVTMKRDGEVLKAIPFAGIRLYGPKRIPWSFHYHMDNIIAESLSKDKEQAIAYADKKRIENFLNPKWLALLNNTNLEQDF